ncbi:MAG: hypothetical protein ACTHLE_04705 [Agriterribacter sp.]
MMKHVTLLAVCTLVILLFANAQNKSDRIQKDITLLIDQYSQAREQQDTLLLKKILTTDIDQLVSTGEWRAGVAAAVKGMQQSSASNPGSRLLKVEKIKLLNRSCAIADCRYEIKNTDGTTRKMWSTFIVVAENSTWKISAIRNMKPTEEK